ncbi:MAG TPA: DUF4124 domain-containing protein [Arenimonas sp.]|uniref:DUF4124 domain-containing protein n=1 Tax=Arenimonas sp. TaxID=1872635 RepID=UPI002D7EEB0F|nr:DUF4124 domain-containing protein [Arenimonas sp.]HEU0154115.1 DUF4124 domain-containing protein [Arenimonas sp.]
MRPVLIASLASLLALVGPSAAEELTVYRCQDAGGRVTLQDEPCPSGQQQSTRSMVRPRDPAPAPAAPRPAPAPEPAEAPPPEADYALPFPPPPLFQCTDFDGSVRFSEDYDPNTRCVPLPVLGYDVRGSSAAAGTCRWVSESCLRLDDDAACEQFKKKLKQARSDALHAFSDTAAYRKSELKRLDAIVAESCR